MIDSETVTRARAVPIVHELDRRGIKLRRVGHEILGPCPVCGGRDRFAVHLRKQVWLCRRCERGGGVVDLVMHLDGVGFPEALAILASGERPALTRQRKLVAQPAMDCTADDERKRQRALQWWEEAGPIEGTLAERYLTETRRLVLPPGLSPDVLRFHPDCPFGDDGRYPCLLALYRRIELPHSAPPDQPVEAEPRAVMRTALTADGKKIGRMAYGPVRGAAIKLSDDTDVTMGLTIGEGVETTLAGMMKGYAPAWALGSSGGIAKFPVLAGIEALTVLAETGDGGANERATRECSARWHAAGLEVFRAIPLIGDDFNDALTVAVSGETGDATKKEKAPPLATARP